ncbi:MAG: hypothetical protein E6J00_02750 [Chloroflexi bacterium]|nr:MAG: hypothetical protein E6J00_02750 [Chloroflexota bacterium]
MPVVPFEVRTGYRVEARDGELGVVREIFNGPPRSMFVDSEPYVRVSSSGQPDLNVPLSEVVDVSEVKGTVYLRRWLREIDALRWTGDPRNPSLPAPPFRPRRPLDGRAAVERRTAAGEVVVPPRPRVELGTWQPGEMAPRPEPGRQLRIGDRFQPGDRIPLPGQYMCTVCRFRRHSSQFLEENPDGRFPPPHHPGALWELEDLRP